MIAWFSVKCTDDDNRECDLMSVKTAQKSAHSVVFIACAILVTALFSIDLFSPALPAMQHDLGISQSVTKMMVVMMFIAIGVSQLFWGPLSDSIGRSKVMMLGLLVLAAGNMMSIFANTEAIFLLSRFIAGIGAGACMVSPRTLICDRFKTKESLTATYSIVAMAAQVSPAFAPVLGGLTQHLLTWRYDFVLLSLISFVMLFILVIVNVETLPEKKRFKTEVIVSNYKQVFKSKTLWYYATFSGLTFGFLLSFIMLVPFLLQHHYGMSPLVNGIFYMVMPLGIIIGSFSTRRLMALGVSHAILLFGASCAMVVLSIVLYASSQWFDSMWFVLAFCWLNSLAIGVVAPIQTSLSLFDLREQVGVASAVQSMIKMGTAAIVSMLLFHIHITNLLSFAEVFIALSVFLMFFVVSEWRKV